MEFPIPLKRTTKVIHIKDAPSNWKGDPSYVYIGRQGQGLSGEWGNPIRLNKEGDRATVLKAYIEWLHQQDITFFLKMRQLKGKTLVCFCAPKLCHGDILALLADIV